MKFNYFKLHLACTHYFNPDTFTHPRLRLAPKQTKLRPMPEAIVASSTAANPEKIETILNLFRHLNPSETEANLNLISEALPELKESLREVVDVPSRVIVAGEANNREFLSFATKTSDCGSCYRCPWDNKMYNVEGVVCECPSFNQANQELNHLEMALNEAVRTYASLYYGSDSITSVYINGSDSNEFSVAILIKKRAEIDDEDNNSSSRATWDSVHLFEIQRDNSSDSIVYQHTATVMLSFDNSVETLKNIKLAGHLIRQNESTHPATSNHLINIGAMLEESESRLRNDLQSVYFGRTHDIVNEVRSAMPDGFLRNQADFRDEMLAKLKNRE